MAGRSSEDESYDVASTSTGAELFNHKGNNKLNSDTSNNSTVASEVETISEKSTTGSTVEVDDGSPNSKSDKNIMLNSEMSKEQQQQTTTAPNPQPSDEVVTSNGPTIPKEQPLDNTVNPSHTPLASADEGLDAQANEEAEVLQPPTTEKNRDLHAGGDDEEEEEECKRDKDTNDDENNKDEQQQDTDDTAIINKIVARKYFWSAVAVGSFALGVGFLLMALRISDDSARQRRRWTSRRY